MTGLSRAKTHEAGRQDFGDFGEALGWGQLIRRQGIGAFHVGWFRQIEASLWKSQLPHGIGTSRQNETSLEQLPLPVALQSCFVRLNRQMINRQGVVRTTSKRAKVARSLFRGAPELSRLFIESPIELLSEFLSHSQFAMFLGEAIAAVPADGDEQARRDAMAAVFKNLKADRTHLIEIEARRVMSMTDNIPETMLRRLGEETQFGARGG